MKGVKDMAEEIKKEEIKCVCGNNFAIMSKVVLGLLFLGLGVAFIILWRLQLLTLIKGCAGPFLVLAGIVTLAIAKE